MYISQDATSSRYTASARLSIAGNSSNKKGVQMNFDWKTYINNYVDLQKAGINTKEKAKKHWIQYGKKENRTFNKIYT